MRGGRVSVVWTAVVAAAALAGAPAAGAGTLFVVQGGGWGHGVGLGQWGAEGYALHGWDYKRILAHYYPHTTFTHVASQRIRILIGENVDRVAVGSVSPYLLVDARGRKVHVKARTLQFSVKLVFAKHRLVPPLEVQPGAQPLTYDGKPYHGAFTLLRTQGKLSVVDTVPLELYLRGVVPSEMPKLWDPAAYEAQAVAARSYALAEMRGTGSFDLYGDSRDQMYGGIDAETPATSAAVGATAGQILTYDGRAILAYYSASTGGRTESVEDAFPGRTPIPYLVSVSDPYDTISPLHKWRVRLDLDRAASRLGFTATDVRVEHDAAGHVTTVELVGASGTKTMTGNDFSQALGLRSDRFTIEALSLEAPAAIAQFNRPYELSGFVRNVSGVSLQEVTPLGGWRLAGHVHPGPDGRFAITVRPRLSTTYRLAFDKVAGAAVDVSVAPRLLVRARGNVMTGTIEPSVPLRVERQIGGAWRVVAHLPVGPSGYFRKKLRNGRYRITSSPSPSRHLSSTASPTVVIRK